MSFTSNYYRCLAVSIMGLPSNGTANIVNYSGTTTNSVYTDDYKSSIACGLKTSSSGDPYMGRVQTSLGSSGGVIFGDGTEPEAVSDYKLSGNILSTITSTCSLATEYNDAGVIVTGVYTLTNTSDEAIVVGEVGLLSGRFNKMLVERTVLDKPITIPAGGIGQVTYTIRMNYPTA